MDNLNEDWTEAYYEDVINMTYQELVKCIGEPHFSLFTIGGRQTEIVMLLTARLLSGISDTTVSQEHLKRLSLGFMIKELKSINQCIIK